MVAGGTHRIVMPASDWGKVWSFWPIGDIHWGAKGCDKEKIAATIASIKRDPRSRWLGMGDYFDMITLKDEKRLDVESLDGDMIDLDNLGCLADAMVDVGKTAFTPIADKCIALLAGNHETKTTAFISHTVKRLAAELKVPYFGYSAFVDVAFVNEDDNTIHKFRIACHHGAGAARTKGGKVNRVETFTYDMDADIMLYGHIHVRFDDEVVELGANEDCTKLKEFRKLAVATGTFLRTYHADAKGASGYGEKAQYRPTPLGSPCIRITPSTGDVSITKGFGPITWRP